MGAALYRTGPLPNHEVDQLAGNDDLLDDLFAVEVAAHVLALAGEREQLLLARPGVGLDPVAQLAVDLNHEGDGVAGEQCRVGRGPGLLPDPATLDPLPDLRSEVRREGEDQRGGGGGGEAHRGEAGGLGIE